MTDPFRHRHASKATSSSSSTLRGSSATGSTIPSTFTRQLPPHISTFPPDSASTLVSGTDTDIPKRFRSFIPRASSTLLHPASQPSPATPTPAPQVVPSHPVHAPIPVRLPNPAPLPSHDPPVFHSPSRPVSVVLNNLPNTTFTPPSPVPAYFRPPSVFLNTTPQPVATPVPLARPITAYPQLPPHPVRNQAPQGPPLVHPQHPVIHQTPVPAPHLPPQPHFPQAPAPHPPFQHPFIPPLDQPAQRPVDVGEHQLPPYPNDLVPPVAQLDYRYAYTPQQVLYHPVHPPPHTDSKLPPLTTIPRFTSAADWGLWFNPVMALIDHMGLNGHVCPLPIPGAPYDPTCRLAVPPPYPPHLTRNDSLAYETFWKNDNICSYIISGRLSAEIFNSLPPARTGPYNFPTRTARDLLNFLRKRFSVGSAASAQRVKDLVFRLSCAPNTIPAYVQSWRIAVNQLATTVWDFTQYEKIQRFMDGIPDHRAYNVLWEEVRRSWDNNPDGTFDFFTLANTILEIDIDVRRRQAVSHTQPKTQNSQRASSNAQPSSSLQRHDSSHDPKRVTPNEVSKDNLN